VVTGRAHTGIGASGDQTPRVADAVAIQDHIADDQHSGAAERANHTRELSRSFGGAGRRVLMAPVQCREALWIAAPGDTWQPKLASPKVFLPHPRNFTWARFDTWFPGGPAPR